MASNLAQLIAELERRSPTISRRGLSQLVIRQNSSEQVIDLPQSVNREVKTQRFN